MTAERLLREALATEPENELLQDALNSTIQRRDVWLQVLYNLAIPIGFWVTGLNFFGKLKWQPLGTFYLYCIIFCLICGLPLAALFLLPGMIYVVMTYWDDQTERGTTSVLTAAKRLLFSSVTVRRTIWLPIAIGWWAFTIWSFSIPFLWGGAAVVVAIVLGVGQWALDRRRDRARAARLKAFVAPDYAEAPISQATPSS